MANALDELKAALSGKKAVIGTQKSLKSLKLGKLKKLFIASNCPESVKEDIRQYAGDCKVTQLDVPNDELGTICRKQFSVAVISILK